ncbi:hypothetical protein KIL84_015655, partial [Mauremys mutica]
EIFTPWFSSTKLINQKEVTGVQTGDSSLPGSPALELALPEQCLQEQGCLLKGLRAIKKKSRNLQRIFVNLELRLKAPTGDWCTNGMGVIKITQFQKDQGSVCTVALSS